MDAFAEGMDGTISPIENAFADGPERMADSTCETPSNVTQGTIYRTAIGEASER